jgi:four helix bundle suffix protein
MSDPERLIPPHGGYRRLKSFQVAQLVYDVTVRFCDRYIGKRSRTHDQMVQAARSGVQNIAEGSQASGTSKKSELKLTNVARASLEELRLDYEDFLRQRSLAQWRTARTNTDAQGLTGTALTVGASVYVRGGPCPSVPGSAELVANAALSLLNLCCYLLDRQLASLERAFAEEGGFTERLYRVRSRRRAR